MSDTVTLMQNVHASVLSIPTLLNVVREFNNSTAANGTQIMTVDDLRNRLGLTITKSSSIPVSINHPPNSHLQAKMLEKKQKTTPNL